MPDRRKKQGRGVFVVIGLVLLVISVSVGVSYVTYLVLNKVMAGEEITLFKTAARNEVGPTINLDEFIVNLESPSRTVYARFTIVMEVFDKGCIKEVEKRIPQIRDTVIATLRGKTPADIDKDIGLKYLKDDLLEAFSDLLGRNIVKSLSFTDFVVQ